MSGEQNSTFSSACGLGNSFCSFLNGLIGGLTSLNNQEEQYKMADTNAKCERLKSKLAAEMCEAMAKGQQAEEINLAKAKGLDSSTGKLGLDSVSSWIEQVGKEDRECYPVGSII